MYLIQLGRKILIKLGVIKKPIVYTQVQESSDLSILKLDGVVKCIDSSLDGNIIVCALLNHIKVYNSSLTILIATLVGHTHDVNQVKIFKSSMIASCSDDKTVRIWNAQNLKLMVILQGHKDSVKRIEFSSETTIIAVGSDRTIIWGIRGGQQISVIPYTVEDIQQLPNQQIIIQDYDNCLRFWDLRTNKLVKSVNCGFDYYRSVVIQNKIITKGWFQKIISFCDHRTGKVIRNFMFLEEYGIDETALDPNSKFLILSDAQKRIRICNLLNGLQENCANYNKLDYVSAMTFTKDGNYILSGGFNQTLRKTTIKSLLKKD